MNTSYLVTLKKALIDEHFLNNYKQLITPQTYNLVTRSFSFIQSVPQAKSCSIFSQEIF